MSTSQKFQPPPTPIVPVVKKQLHRRTNTDYDKLLLSLQSPLPNEQDMAISVCTLLCNETKHVIRLTKCPSILTYLLAHTGVYRDCGVRKIIEELYKYGRNMDLAKFWEDVPVEGDIKSLLCESYIKRIESTMELEDQDLSFHSIDNMEDSGSGSDDELNVPPGEFEFTAEAVDDTSPAVPAETETPPTTTDVLPETTEQEPESGPSDRDPEPNDRDPEPNDCDPEPSDRDPEPEPEDTFLNKSNDSPPPARVNDNNGNDNHFIDLEESCCPICPCNRTKQFDSDKFDPPPTLARSHDSEDKVSKRVHQIAAILRNLSFEEDNAEIMAGNPTMLRYLLLTANCSFGSLMQYSFDTISNVAKYIRLQDPCKDPITSILMSSIISGLFSEDRLKIICSLDALRNLTRTERNEKILAALLEGKICNRLCELLSLCDIMLLIYTLECVHAITGIGEPVCNEIVRVKGSVATFIALVTVEAQSYGPKGCIQMRVVETYTGGTHISQGSNSQLGAMSSSNASSSITCSSQIPVATKPVSTSSRTVSGHTIVPPSPSFGTSSLSSTSPNHILVSPSSIRPVSPINQGLRVLSQQTPSSVTLTASQSLQWLPSSPSHSSTSSSSLPRSISPIPVIQAQLTQTSTKINCLQNTPVGVTASSPNVASASPTQLANNYETVVRQSQTQQSTISLMNNGTSEMKSLTSATPTTIGASTSSVPGGLVQVSSHSFTQQVYTPSIKSENVTEEVWATAWVQGGFEQVSGTSIEEGEVFRMYCAARKKHPSALLSQSQLLQCVKSVYGTCVGPVVKSFGSTSLSFLEGLRPKISVQTTSVSPVQVPVTANGLTNDGTFSNTVVTSMAAPRPSTPVGNPSSPLSPILKATLSRPPTPKPSSSPPKGKNERSKERKSKAIATNMSTKKKGRRGTEILQNSKPQATGKLMSPSSSAIRSLLASKVAQRQQKKMQQETKCSKKSKNSKMNGEAIMEKEESSASSSLPSMDEAEMKADLSPTPLTFQGILCNGMADFSKDAEEEDAENNAKVKGMLVDLLEKKVAHKDAANGIVGPGRDIRISEKGLELINNPIETEGALFTEALGVIESQEPQKMTFYASPEVVTSVQPCTTINAANPETILLRGGGEESSTFGSDEKSEQHEVNSENVENDSYGASLGDGTCNINANSDSNDESGGGNDLFEKFSQFSDLIVVNPEQLGIGVKRPAPSSSEKNPSHNSEDKNQPPPPKKAALFVNGNDDVPSMDELPPSPTVSTSVISSVVTTASSNPVLQNALSSFISSQQSIKPNSTSSSLSASSTGIEETKIAVTSSNNSMFNVPVRYLNAQNSQQITFAGRPMVLQSGQIVLSGGSTMAGLMSGQGQVIISKHGGGSEGLTKAIILIPQQSSNSQSGQVTIPVGATTSQQLLNPIQVLLNSVNTGNSREGVPAHTVANISPEILEQELPYLCEWTGCGYRFTKYQQVFMHAVNVHCPDPNSPDPVRCEWGANGCDPLLRKRFSIMTHLQDRHCNKQALDMAVYRRKNKLEAPPVPQQPVHHPGYAPNAAFHAIKRHALQYMNPKDVLEENEGPVTKSIRLTSALILRNLVNFSPQGRRIIASHESQLSTIAMSNAESARTISQMLFDMSEATTSTSSTE